jgi:hypothetical protein
VSPTTESVPFGSPATNSSTVVTHRASPMARANVDRYLGDVFSEECVACRTMSFHQHELFRPANSGSSNSSLVRQRLALKDNHVLRRRRSDVDLRPDRIPMDPVGKRMSLSRTFSTYAVKRSSVASSIKRGLSVGSHDGFTALALVAQEAAEERSIDSPEAGNSTDLNDSPRMDADDLVASPSATDFGLCLLPHRQAQQSSDTDPSNQGGAPTVVRRKSSFSNLIATVRKRPQSRARSMPASPNPSRPNSLITADQEKHCPPSRATNHPEDATIASVSRRPPSTIFGKSFRSRSFDGASVLDPHRATTGPAASPRETPSDGQVSRSVLPVTVLHGHANSSEDLLGKADALGIFSRKVSNTSSEASGAELSECDGMVPAEGARRPAPKRQRSIRFFGLSRLTRISGGGAN